MAIATSCARSFLRSTCFRNAAPKLAFGAKSSSRPSFGIPKQKPFCTPSFRSPVELSSCLDSLMPFHTATASALLTSMLSVSRSGYSWLPEGKDETK